MKCAILALPAVVLAFKLRERDSRQPLLVVCCNLAAHWLICLGVFVRVAWEVLAEVPGEVLMRYKTVQIWTDLRRK